MLAFNWILLAFGISSFQNIGESFWDFIFSELVKALPIACMNEGTSGHIVSNFFSQDEIVLKNWSISSWVWPTMRKPAWTSAKIFLWTKSFKKANKVRFLFSEQLSNWRYSTGLMLGSFPSFSTSSEVRRKTPVIKFPPSVLAPFQRFFFNTMEQMLPIKRAKSCSILLN